MEARVGRRPLLECLRVPMSRQAPLISAICSSVRRSAASAVASGSMIWRNSCTVLRNVSRLGEIEYQPSTSRSSRFHRSRGSTQLPIFGREDEQAFRHQHLDRLADRRTADFESLRPLLLVGQDGPGRIVAAHDALADLAGKGCMNAAAGHAGAPAAAGASARSPATDSRSGDVFRFSFLIAPAASAVQPPRTARRSPWRSPQPREYDRKMCQAVAGHIDHRNRARRRLYAGARTHCIVTSGCRCRPCPWCIRRGR